MDFGRVVTAMVTPFDSKGNVDFPKVTKLIEYLINNGSDGVVVAGTTGESPTLTTEEKVALFRHVMKVVDGRIRVIAGTGSNNTYSSVELTRKAEEIGVDGVMLVAPYYNKPSQMGLYEHFKAIAEKTTLPIMIYNVPGRTMVNIEAETVIALSKIDNIVAVKEASGNLDQMTWIIANTDEDFHLYSGDDSLILPILSIGGAGVVSVASHIIGNEIQDIFSLYESGNVKEAAEMHQKYFSLIKGLFMAPSPTPVKTALQLIGLDVGGVRLPLVPLTSEERSLISSLLENK
ncbi:4-hydroxy-tetrahydrodipicolinate synthase [Evansella cellulosilytica]|uniref:4-hydroxy-tetrahydrodipicolinate synthase n=1 Tax=Evansella cellulosilytica (strain ATCC 21833 / DSM 2522 / FERM P-1141 / JCM 9156 / N-4) TaxID=649639 RepID=E6TS45_EVAC2|nr:4-hydroxy-tetrahydrodipicolinate synthase [Evansella cellulosilytica]ADU30699.1 dihydrodipicolinate synthase [Evansella cellulosilytica DSM 2522]